jgi:hypothetical protein
MLGICNYIPETNLVSMVVVYLQFVLQVTLFLTLNMFIIIIIINVVLGRVFQSI